MESFVINTSTISTNIDTLSSAKTYYKNKKSSFSSTTYGYNNNLSSFLSELREIYDYLSNNIDNVIDYLTDLKKDVEIVENKLSGGSGSSVNSVINNEINKHVNSINLCNINDKIFRNIDSYKPPTNYTSSSSKPSNTKDDNTLATVGMCTLAFGEGVVNVVEMIVDGGAMIVSGACSAVDFFAGTNSAESVNNFVEYDWSKDGYYRLASATGLDQYADPDSTAAKVCSGVGSFAGVVGLSLVTGGAAAAAYGAGTATAATATAAAGAGIGFLTNSGSAGEMALQGGASNTDALKSAYIAGGYGALTGGIGGKLDALARGAGGIGQVFKYSITNFGIGASEPVVNEVADTIIYQNDGESGFINNFLNNAKNDGLLFNMAFAGGTQSVGTIGNSISQKLSFNVNNNQKMTKINMEDLIYNKTKTVENLGNFLKSNIRKFSYTNTNNIPGLNQKIKTEGLYHFTNNVDSILSSGHIKASDMIASYGNKKTFFFNGIPEVGAYATNLDSIPLKTEAIKIIPNDDIINSPNLKVRSQDDGAISFDGKFNLDNNQASKEYLVLIKDGDKLVYKNVSKEFYDNYQNTPEGKQISDFISNKSNVNIIKNDYYNKLSLKDTGAFVTTSGKQNYQSALDKPQKSSKEIISIDDQINIFKQKFGAKNTSIFSFDVESLDKITIENINKIKKNFNDCDILFITPDQKRHRLSDVEYRLKTYDEITLELDVSDITKNANNISIKKQIDSSKISVTDKNSFEEKFKNTLRLDDTNVSIIFNDAKQFCYRKLRTLAATDPEAKQFMDSLFNEALKNPNKDLKVSHLSSYIIDENKIVSFLFRKGALSDNDVNLINQMKKNEVNFTQEEKDVAAIFTIWYGPNLAAYNRGIDINFNTRNVSCDPKTCQRILDSAITILNNSYGKNIKSMTVDEFNSIVDGMIGKHTVPKGGMIVTRTANSLFFDNNYLQHNNLVPGVKFNDKAHVSTSACYEKFNNDYILKIYLPEGTPITYLEQITGVGNYNQQEILLGRNNCFEIKSLPIRRPDGKYELKVELITDNLPNKRVSSYAKTFGINKGITGDELVNAMKNKQLYDRYISEIDDVVSKKLYDDIILGEHGYDHMNMVLLNSMYMGNKLNLTSKEMDILIESAKFHDCGLKGNKTDKGHAKISALIAEKYLNGKYSTKEVAFIKSIIEYHEIEDSLEDLKNICYNNGIYDIDEINDVKKIANILKDADGIDRIRFPGNLNFQKIRNKEIAKEIILADYDLREKMATEELLELISVQNNINNKNIEEVQFLMNSGQFPNYIIKFAYKYYKNFGWDNITEYANAIINSGTFSVRRKK